MQLLTVTVPIILDFTKMYLFDLLLLLVSNPLIDLVLSTELGMNKDYNLWPFLVFKL